MKITKILFFLLFLLLILGGYFGYNYFFSEEPSETYNKPIYTPKFTNNVQINNYNQPTLSVDELKAIIQRSPMFSELPKDAVIVLAFFDGNGNLRNDLKFSVYNGGEVKNYQDPNYDFMLTTGDYYIDKIKSSNDLCSTLKDIKKLNDLKINRRISAVSATVKYRSLLEYRDCFY